MNILPKKNWHVLKRENILKVKKDIAEAKAKDAESLRKSEICGQENYLNILRKNSKYTKSLTNLQGSDLYGADPLHLAVSTTNDEYEREKKETIEKSEKSIGLLTYLGQSLKDPRTEDELWWTKGGTRCSSTSERHKQKEEMRIKKDDPLEFILSCQKKIDEQKPPKFVRSYPHCSKEDFIEKRPHKSKKHKKDKKKKRKLSSSSSDNDSDEYVKRKKQKQMNNLRKERVSREMFERERADQLMKRSHSNKLFPSAR